MGSRLTILLWPARMAGRVAKGALKKVISGEAREPWAPTHPPPPGDARAPGGRAETIAGGAYIKPSSTTDGATAATLTITQLEVRERFQQRDSLVLIDVREPHEVDQGYIPGAVHIPLGQLAARFQELDPGHTVVAYCASGVRSVDAAKILRDLGIPRAHSLAGGFARWVRDGGEVARPGAPSGEPRAS